MASTTTSIKAVRLPNDLIDYIDHDTDNPLRNVLESLYGLVRSGKVEISGGEIKIPSVEGVNTDIELSKYGITLSIIADLAEMVKLCGGNLGEVLENTRERLESGELTIDNGHLEMGDEIDLTRLREIAERYHKEPQEVLNIMLDRSVGG